MLLLLCVALGLTALAVTLRWTTSRVDAMGRPVPFPALSVTASASVALLGAVPVVQHARLEARLADVAGELAGRTVEVECQTLSGSWLETETHRGYVAFGPDGPAARATITHDTCNGLRDWTGGRHATAAQVRAVDLEQVIAVHVLTHEAMHLAGLRDEALAECAAVQRDARTATLLGAAPEAARELARRYLVEVHPQLPDAYRSDRCGPGGDLDEHLETSPWS